MHAVGFLECWLGPETCACVPDLQVAFAWAVSIEPEEGTQLLLKLGLLDPALDYALESGAFAQAFQLCQAPPAHHKMPECHLKYAMHLEDEGKPKRRGGGGRGH